MEPLTSEEIQKVNDKVADLIAQGSETEAKQYLAEQLPRFPEKLRKEIMLEMFVSSMIDESATRESIAHLREQGVTAVETLEELKKDIEAEGASPQ